MSGAERLLPLYVFAARRGQRYLLSGATILCCSCFARHIHCRHWIKEKLEQNLSSKTPSINNTLGGECIDYTDVAADPGGPPVLGAGLQPHEFRCLSQRKSSNVVLKVFASVASGKF
jgi:hypothetical protein